MLYSHFKFIYYLPYVCQLQGKQMDLELINKKYIRGEKKRQRHEDKGKKYIQI